MKIQVFKIMLNFVIILLFHFVMTNFAEQTDYCSLHSNHFLCSKRAPNRDLRGVRHFPGNDETEIRVIIAHFNYYRSERAKGTRRGVGKPTRDHASNMLLMQWDEELATIAQMITSRRAEDVSHFSFCCGCNILDRFESNAFIHEDVSDTEYFNWKDTLVNQFFRSIQASINPEQKENIKKLDMKFWLKDPVYLLVRSEIYLVGCDLAIYKLKQQIRHRFACVFGPITSWINDKVYDFGPPCSKCPNPTTACSSDYRNLCKCEDVCYLNRTKLLSNSEAVTSAYPKDKRNVTMEKKRYCRTNQRHFLCDLTNSYYAECIHKEILPKTDSYRMKILQVFNQYRNKVAGGNENLGGVPLPSASNMLQLDWDRELEMAAKNIVDSCRLRYFEFCCNCHQFDRFTANFFQIEIQNVAKLDTKEPDWDIILDLLLEKYWTHDIRSFNVNNITDEFYSEMRFELIARAEVQRLGCAITKFRKGPIIDTEKGETYLAVCVFAGLSGWKGTPIYTPGPPCSNCGRNTMCSRDPLSKNLCVCQTKQYCFSPPNMKSFVWFDDSQWSIKEGEFVPERDIKEMETKYHVTRQPQPVIEITTQTTSEITTQKTSEGITQKTSEGITQKRSEGITQITSKSTAQMTSKRITQMTSERTPKHNGISTAFLYHNVWICFAYFICIFIYT